MAAPDIKDIDEIVYKINMKAAVKNIHKSSERPSAAASEDESLRNSVGNQGTEHLELVEASMSGSLFKPLVNGQITSVQQLFDHKTPMKFKMSGSELPKDAAGNLSFIAMTETPSKHEYSNQFIPSTLKKKS